ncbi:MAG: endonuclease III [Bacteroidales bacterium]|nr:endonuclease III [Bacteroidales bacterium]MBP5723845.1 endonuclease III [Bacteroidales bacterium]MBQ4215758.1 endonuclease III [Bacteroidales bacterium]MBR4498799.1 endonuclease III [Bacteroidales bacterium]
MNIEEKYSYCMQRFAETMPNPQTELSYNNPFELLVAVILSAQCTDKRVNMITPNLFKAFPTPKAMSEASEEQIFNLIKSCSYPQNKAKHLKNMAIMLHNEYHDQIPDDVEEMQKLPGVGRKTANVMAAVIFKKPAMAVDTHVFRVSARIGLVHNAKTPLETEKQLMRHIPKDKVHDMHHWLILHGRYTCKAIRPECHNCPITAACETFNHETTEIKNLSMF